MGGKWKILTKTLKTFRWLSFDVVIGAIAGGIFAAKITNSYPGHAWLIILALSVWIVYTADHLIDGIRLKDDSTAQRHIFHYYHRKTLSILVLILSGIGFIAAVMLLDIRIIIFGIVLGLFIIIYLAVVMIIARKGYRKLPKEIFVAFVYVAGIWGAPVILAEDISPGIILIIITYFLLALANLMVLSLYEYGPDKEGHQASLIQWVNLLTGTKLTYIILVIVPLICFLVVARNQANIIACGSALLSLMSVLMIIILSYPSLFTKHASYRWLGEMIFWLPFLIVFL